MLRTCLHGTDFDTPNSPRLSGLVDVRFAICRACYDRAPRALTDEVRRAYVPGMTIDEMTTNLRRALGAIEAYLHSQATADDGQRRGKPSWETVVRMVREKDAARAKLREQIASDPDSVPWIKTAKRRPDGWPLCPGCGEDELWSLDDPPSEATIRGCHNCPWKPAAPKAFRHLSLVP